ncbi:MAG: hypothetical protein WCK78_03605 [Paludibacter sp.]
MKIKITLFLLLIVQQFIVSQDIVKSSPFIFYPGAYQKREYKISTGISMTRLPNQIVEEEINTLPMINADFRLGLPLKIELHSQLNTNYISNMFSFGLQKNIIDGKIGLAVGANASLWYGQLHQEVIRLDAFGGILNPYIIGGIRFNDVYLSLKVENQYGIMKTFSEGVSLGKSSQPNSAYSFLFTIEQPLWNNHWVALGFKLNYAKFNYQSWLTYSAINQFLLYPEYSFKYIF